MKILIQLCRMLRIYWVMMRYHLGSLLLQIQPFPILKCLIYFNPYYYWYRKIQLPLGERIRLALEELGPIFIKLGQIASTRIDWLPEEIVQALAQLQDRVTPFSEKTAIALIEEAIRCPIHTIFAEFNEKALASASIAQVHAARLKSGESVVIKVLRPRIKALIDQDIALLRTIASLVNRYLSHFKQFKLNEIVDEIAQTLHEELDLLREGANAAQLRRNFLHSTLLYIPKIYWEYSSHNLLVMEQIKGIPIYNIQALKVEGFHMPALAKQWIQIFLLQVLRDNFFHADLHPGNIFISKNRSNQPQFIAVDCGIAGSLSPEDQHYIAENMVAFLKRDYQRVAQLHIRCGWLPTTTRVDQFTRAIRAVCEPIFARPLQEISLAHLLLQLLQVTRHFQMNIQPQLVLLQKTLFGVEALGRQLFPLLNIWEIVTPEIEKWLKKQAGIKAFLYNVRNNFPLWAAQCPQIPTLIYERLSKSPSPTSPEPSLIPLIEKSVHQALRHSILKYYYFFSGASTACFLLLLGYWYYLK